MTIKYEDLWDENVQLSLAAFLNKKSFRLPKKLKRGEFKKNLSQIQGDFMKIS